MVVAIVRRTQQQGGEPRPSGERARASMVDQADIWRAVNLLAKHYGTDAALAAAQRAQELLAVGDVNGFTVWKRILESAAELSRTKPGTGEWMN